jgi:hypothetical protein
MRVRDETVPLNILGLREQLTPLAAYLAETTNLTIKRFARVSGEGQSSTDVILIRCISPLALYYLRSLRNLGSADEGLTHLLADELHRLITSDEIVHVNHLPIAGVRPGSAYQYREVSIRPLSPRERGSWAELNFPTQTTRFVPGSDYIPHVPYPNFTPSSLIEIRTVRPIAQQFDTSSLPRKVALAFFLMTYDLSSSGYISNFDWPSWSAMGRWHTPFPISEKMSVVSDKELTEEDFNAVVRLAYKMPDFGRAETSGREVVLFRVLQALGAPAGYSGFLDLVIALEAALLAGTTSELSYRFSLYGSLFLLDQYDPQETFASLRNIYQVRSALVHGGHIKSDAIQKANKDAPELARAVTRKAIESGWPDSKVLDRLALGGVPKGSRATP